MDEGPPVALPPGLAPRYEPVRRLGSGGFGHVILVRDRELGRPVALKLARAFDMTASQRGRFEREAALTARVHHPHVVRLYDFGMDDGRAWLAYEFIEGSDLAAVLARGAPPTLATWVGWARQGTDALAALHREKILHRDVKPANLLVRADGALVLGDLGLARLDVSGETLTATGAVVGTPRYIAPELWDGADAGETSDQYSWGIVLAELLFGPAAVVGRPPRPVQRPAGLPPGLEPLAEVVERAAAANPARRFRGLKELAAGLEKAVARTGDALGGAAPWDAGGEARVSGLDVATVARARPSAALGGRVPVPLLILAGLATVGAGWWWAPPVPARAPGPAGPAGPAGPGGVARPAEAVGPAGEEAREVLDAAGKLARAFVAAGIPEAELATVGLRSEAVRGVLRDPDFLLRWNRLAGRALEWLKALRAAPAPAPGGPFADPVAARVLGELVDGGPGLALEALFLARRDAEALESSGQLPRAVLHDGSTPDPLLDSTELFREYHAPLRPLVQELAAWTPARPLGVVGLEVWLRANAREVGPVGFAGLLARLGPGGTPVERQVACKAVLQALMRSTSEGEITCKDRFVGLAAVVDRVASGGEGSPTAGLEAEVLRVQSLELRLCRDRVSPEEVVQANAVLARLLARRDRLAPRERERITAAIETYREPREFLFKDTPREILPLVEAMERLLGRPGPGP